MTDLWLARLELPGCFRPLMGYFNVAVAGSVLAADFRLGYLIKRGGHYGWMAFRMAAI